MFANADNSHKLITASRVQIVSHNKLENVLHFTDELLPGKTYSEYRKTEMTFLVANGDGVLSIARRRKEAESNFRLAGYAALFGAAAVVLFGLVFTAMGLITPFLLFMLPVVSPTVLTAWGIARLKSEPELQEPADTLIHAVGAFKEIPATESRLFWEFATADDTRAVIALNGDERAQSQLIDGLSNIYEDRLEEFEPDSEWDDYHEQVSSTLAKNALATLYPNGGKPLELPQTTELPLGAEMLVDEDA